MDNKDNTSGAAVLQFNISTYEFIAKCGVVTLEIKVSYRPLPNSSLTSATLMRFVQTLISANNVTVSNVVTQIRSFLIGTTIENKHAADDANILVIAKCKTKASEEVAKTVRKKCE